MPLNYDTGYEYVFPPYLFEDDQIEPILTICGLKPQLRGNLVRLFRSPETAFALLLTGEKPISLVLSAGVGVKPLEVHDTPETDKGQFLIKELRKIAQQYNEGGHTEQGVRTDVANLHLFMKRTIEGTNTMSSGQPVNAGWMVGMKQPRDRFDVRAAMLAIDQSLGDQASSERKPGLLKRLFGGGGRARDA